MSTNSTSWENFIAGIRTLPAETNINDLYLVHYALRLAAEEGRVDCIQLLFDKGVRK